MDTLLRYFQARAFARGFRGYHTAWIVVGTALWMLNRSRHRDNLVFRTKLDPGEQLIVKTTPPNKSSGR